MNEFLEGKSSAKEGAALHPRTVLIAGPTASGKSQLALDLAARLDAVIINADSMQVYDGLSILTARPSPTDLGRAEHLLYGHVSPFERYTVARYLGDCSHVLNQIQERGKVAIIVGGTGLYFTGLINGLAPVPQVPEEIQGRVRAQMGQGVLHSWLSEIDSRLAAKLNPADEQRIARGIEVKLATGQSLLDFQAQTQQGIVDRSAVKLVIAPERAWLRERIALRFSLMVASGGLDEARAFSAMNVPGDLPAMKAIGVPEMMAAALGQINLEDGIAKAVISTSQFAKRQETWFRNQFRDWQRLSVDQLRASDALAQEITRSFENVA